jgi:putative transcriptional regulator
MITTPSDEILLKYASGTLDPALRLLVEKHLDLHPASRAVLAEWRQLGGAMLAAETEAALTPGSLDRALARLDAGDPAPASAFLPALEDVRWRWAGPGRAIANIDVPGSAMKTYALRIAPGKAMLQHSHAAEEWTLIIQGSYRDESGEYAAGSFVEEDDETNHRPVATGDVPCICLAVMSGPLSAPGLMGRVAQWMMR